MSQKKVRDYKLHKAKHNVVQYLLKGSYVPKIGSINTHPQRIFVILPLHTPKHTNLWENTTVFKRGVSPGFFLLLNQSWLKSIWKKIGNVWVLAKEKSNMGLAQYIENKLTALGPALVHTVALPKIFSNILFKLCFQQEQSAGTK